MEVMGGLHPAYDFVKACLENGKSVVTSNKELVAQKGAELLAIAQANNLNFLFEASVGGGIPIIRPISQCRKRCNGDCRYFERHDELHFDEDDPRADEL